MSEKSTAVKEPRIRARIRPARPADAPEIARLWREMMNFHMSVDPRFTVVPNSEGMCERYARSVMDRSDYRIFIADVDGKVVGYTMGIILANPEMFTLAEYGFLAEMCVDEELRHSGIGHDLWEALESWFRSVGIKVVQLNVSVNNPKAMNFWTQIGFGPFLNVLWKEI